MTHRTRADRPQDSVNGIIGPKQAPQPVPGLVCQVCLKRIKPEHSVNDISRRRRFCSDRCRLLAWAVWALSKALKAGAADGLREDVFELAKLTGSTKP